MKLEDFFTLEGSEVVVKPIVMQYKSLNDLYKFHKEKNTMEQFLREINFVYFYLNKESYAGYSDENRIRAIKKSVRLPEKWNITRLVDALIDDLKSDLETPSQKALALSNKVLITFMEGMEQAIDEVNIALSNLKEKTKLKDLDKEDRAEIKAEIKAISDELLKLLKTTNEIPKAVLDNEKLTEKTKGETSNNVAFGNKSHHKFEKRKQTASVL